MTTGWNEWAKYRCSLYTGCEHNCRYCFAKADALRFKRIPDAEAWTHPVIRPKERDRKWRKMDGVIGFPATHDITPANLDECTSYLTRMLREGNRVLIVTKAHASCVRDLCHALQSWRSSVEFRVTVTGCDNGLVEYWEPCAPSFIERLESISRAILSEYRVSVSIEPCLDMGNVVGLVENLMQFRGLHSTHGVSEIWIGKMNSVRRRVRIVTDEDRLQVERIEAGQTDERIMEIVRELSGNPLVRWKDSIQEVIYRKAKP